MQIPEEALAAIGADERGFTSDLLIARPEGIWRFSRGSESVRELAMVSEFLDMSLTILQFEDFVDLAEIADEEPRDTYDQFAAGEGS